MNFDDVLEKYRLESIDKVEFGTKFEKLVKQFLETDRYYKEKYSKVYMWNKWPMRDKDQDRGIDLVAETNNGLCAIQCKAKYNDDDSLNAGEMKNFFAMSERKNFKFTERLLVFSGHKLSNTLLEDIEESRINCEKITGDVFRNSSIDWSNIDKLESKKSLLESLFDHQKEAKNKVLEGFKTSNRGKLIMACGTGKTLTALAITLEQVKPNPNENRIVLYLVPSIALVQQSFRDWANQTDKCIFFTVCSDNKVGNDDIRASDLETRATTDPSELKRKLSQKHDKITVIFSTYHSVKVVKDALDGKQIDLVMCDEAHRTATRDNYYSMIHDNKHINAKKRLYMTATEKIFAEKTLRNNQNKGKLLYSMDDSDIFGNTFFEYDFDTAIGDNQLSDFKITVLQISRKLIVDLYAKEKNNNLTTVSANDFTRMCGVWKAIQYPNGSNNDKNLLQRVIIFSAAILESKQIANIIKPNIKNSSVNNPSLELVAKWCNENLEYTDDEITVQHIDGTMNALERGTKIQWLKNSTKNSHECRALSNVRCLSEGVDVPALDGVVFLKPKKTQIEIVQAVGRVLRKSRNKKEGYVIIPVVVPDDVEKDEGLEKSEWETVYSVCRAIRSHDSGFGVSDEPRLKVISIKPKPNGGHDKEKNKNGFQKLLLKPEAKLESEIIEKCGDRVYYDDYCKKLGQKAYLIRKILKKRIEKSHPIKIYIDQFHNNLKSILGDDVLQTDVIVSISEHIVLSRLFHVLFDDNRVKNHDPLTKAFNDVITKIDLKKSDELGGITIDLEEIYKEMEKKLIHIKNARNVENERQRFIEKLYENFFKGEDEENAKQHGIVFTPPSLVNFILYSVQDILKMDFHIMTGLDDRSVKILDPFAGTGIFLTNLINSGMIKNNLYKKYKNDLFSNEIKLLAYHVATINIENQYTKKTNRFVPFEGTSYTDTLQLGDNKIHKIDSTFKLAFHRLERQQKEKINVIVGNPPYLSGRKDVSYDTINKSIEKTYGQFVYGKAKEKIRNSYIQALRWASDRIGDSGIIAFVMPSSFLRSDSMTGIRACLYNEFTDIWCFDLRGDQNGTKGDESLREGGKIFDSGSTLPITITILSKNPKKNSCNIHYKDIGNYLSRDDKFEIIENSKSISGIKDWKTITPDKFHDWLDQRNEQFMLYPKMGNKKIKIKNTIQSSSIFKIYSLGVTSARDLWVYNSSKQELSKNIKRHIDYCNNLDLKNPKKDLKQGSLGGDIISNLKKHGKQKFDESKIRIALYRPFFKQYLYFDPILNVRQALQRSIFPNDTSENLVICVPYKFSDEFSVLITDMTPDLEVEHHGQCFPLYTYENNQKKHNITDYALQEFREWYNDKKITKIDIFYYIYGLFHHPDYKIKYSNNLKKDLPHIPLAPSFHLISKIGKMLADLHINFDQCPRYNLNKLTTIKKITKINWAKTVRKNDKTKIEINGELMFDNIPQIQYKVNGYTPLDWVVSRYQFKTDTLTGITNDSISDVNIIEKIERAIHLGLESDNLIEKLRSEAFEPLNYKKKQGLDKF